jgi:hypothetical protein
MLLIYSYFTFLESVKAVLVHRANRLLSESTLILRTLRNAPGRRQTQLAAKRLEPISTSSFSDSDPYLVACCARVFCTGAKLSQ